MKSRHKKLTMIIVSVALLITAVLLVMFAFQKNLVFFFTPTQVFEGQAPQNKAFRLGGLVVSNSLKHLPDGETSQFDVTDTVHTIQVTYRGMLPDLFKEGRGAVVQGQINQNHVFVADQVLAKHDEKYMPPDAAYALRQAQKEPAP